MKEFIPKTRPDGYNGPVELPQFANNHDWCFEEWLHCRPVRSSNCANKWGSFDQVDDVKPIAVEEAAVEIAYALELLDDVGMDKVVEAQLETWNQAVADALCSLIIPLFGYDDKGGSWKQVFSIWFPQFDIDQLEAIKAIICASEVGVDVWFNNDLIPGSSWYSWLVSVYWKNSPSFNRLGRWVARPDYDIDRRP